MPLTGLAIELRFWFRLALTVSALTGALMVGMNAPDIFAKDAFWVKIAAVVLALILVLGFRDRAVARGGSPKILTAAILFLWLLAASAGRWIGFS